MIRPAPRNSRRSAPALVPGPARWAAPRVLAALFAAAACSSAAFAAALFAPPAAAQAPPSTPSPAPPSSSPSSSSSSSSSAFPRLELREKGTADVWVAYGKAPAFGYGLSPQNLLTCLPPGDARDPDLDYRDFAEWAFAHGVTLVRSYPPSSIVGPRYLDLFERAASDTSRFDLSRYNDAWYARLREACSALRDRHVFVHLQLWQAVTWKKDWDECYYNPDLNVNAELVRHAGPGEFVVDPKRAPELVALQREHVRRVLEATGDLGNVFYDLMNEIGNGTGTSGAWIEAMLDEIEAWEVRRGLDVLVGVNDEGNDRPETGRALSNPRMEIAFLDLGRYDQHVEIRAKHRKPTFGIRNIDWNPRTKERQYFAGEFDVSINPDSTLAGRTERMYWRLFLAKCQMCAGYADYGRLAYRSQPLAGLDLWSFRNFQRIFTDSPWVENYGQMKIAPNTVVESPAPFAYALDSPRAVVAYLESTPGTAGVPIPAGRVLIAPHPGIGKPDARFLRPSDALWTTGAAKLGGDGISVDAPACVDEQVVVIVDSATDTPLQRQTDAAVLSAEREGRGVRLRWDRNLDGLVARVHRLSQASAAAGLPGDRLSLIAGVTDLTYWDEGPGAGFWEYSIVWKDDERKIVYESNRVVVEMPDEPPVAPQIRVVKVDANRVVLWAKGNLEPDVVAYEWERRPAADGPASSAAGDGAEGDAAEGSANDAEWTALEPDPDAYFVDRGLEKGKTLEYRVRAADFLGLRSELSAVVRVTPETPRVPVAPGSIAKVKRLAKPTLVAGALFAGLALGALLAMRAKRRA